MMLVCGEALMDVFGGAETASGLALDARVGGSPFNVAVGLARMGQAVGFLGAVSQDFLGQRLMRALQQEGVDTAPVRRVSAPTTLGLVGMDAQGVPAYTFYGEGGADRQLLADDLSTLPAGLRALHLGSFSCVVEPVAGTLRRLVQGLHRQTLVSYDPNIRLHVQPDLARWRDTLDWMLPRTHLLKVSEEDLLLMRPGEDVEACCDELMQSGLRLLVLTRGQTGVLACSAQGRVSVPALPVQVVDTVGAGDTFQAALLTWLAEHDALTPDALGRLHTGQLQQAMQFAAHAAAITCSRRGADLPRRAELPSG